MDELNVVLSKDGYYWVGTLTAAGLRAYKVADDLQCACGGNKDTPCAHVEAVKAYLRLEGREIPREPSPGLPEACPICGGKVRAEANHWRCSASPGHYWQWRGEQTGVKDFLCRPHPAKQGAFYEMSLDERDAFLEQAHRRLYANGHSPYG